MNPKIEPLTQENLKKFVNELNNGQLIAFPTETVYGLGADATNSKAVQKIFEFKKRPLWNPLIVHISTKDWIYELALVSSEMQPLLNVIIEKFWPGPLTIVLPHNPSSPICAEVLGGLDTIALRMPSNLTALKLIETFNKPIAAPSANIFQHISPSKDQHVKEEFWDKNIIIIQGGPCKIGIESTIIKLKTNNTIKILRKGVIGVHEIHSYLNQIKEGWANFEIENEISRIESPGQMKVHYSPRKPVYLIKKRSEFINVHLIKNSAFVDYGRTFINLKDYFKVYVDLSSSRSAIHASRKFYSILRELEENSSVEMIILYLPDAISSGLEALKDRMVKAAGGKELINFLSKNT